MQRRILFNSNGINSNKTYRGFALPYMREEHGVVTAGLITGIVWGMWHLPLWIDCPNKAR